MLAEFEIVPIGSQSASVSAELAKVAQLIDASGLDYRVSPMGTVVEGNWDEVMQLAKQCHEAMLASADRVITSIKIDDRKDKTGPRMQQKLDSLKASSGVNINC